MSAPKNIEPDESGLYWESRVAEAFGVSRKLLAQLRVDHLERDKHFVRRANNAVALTLLGVQRVENLLGHGQESFAEANGETAAPAGPPVRESMTVERVPQNTGLLLCQSRRGVLVAVRVRVNETFAAGMEFEAVQSHDGVWQFRNRPESAGGNESTVGRLPRRKGVW